jgi:prepilin-type N-terminal cleavage/methylation domain-containing protein
MAKKARQEPRPTNRRRTQAFSLIELMGGASVLASGDGMAKKARQESRPTNRTRTQAFSLIELMVVVSLLSVIILGLMAMFSQTQRAFKLGMNQTDILESGRMATDLITREIKLAKPTDVARGPNPANIAPNFFVDPAYSFVMQNPLMRRTNQMDDLFFVIRENQTWMGVGYFVRAKITTDVNEAFGPVGSLYRYEYPLHRVQWSSDPRVLFQQFDNARFGRDIPVAHRDRVHVSKILDGVVHFRVRVFDPRGNYDTNLFFFHNRSNISVRFTGSGYRAEFHSNAVPGAVEVELGVLESETLERYQGLPPVPPTVRSNYFLDKMANVHLFRQRIPLPNVDLSAYP